MRLELIRDTYSRDMGTFGKLSVFDGESNKLFECDTVERPWANNTPNISCVPCGTYAVRPCRFHRGGYDALQLVDVPNRSLILIHKGNTMMDVQGCIAVGRARGVVSGMWAVTNSADAFGALMEIAPEFGANPPLRIRSLPPDYGWLL